jgi:sulfite exporter TauE/SafE
MKAVRDRSRSQSALAPALLGVATVLTPCRVTLSVEALALASGSALAGAATMAVFVLGTSPLFALLGYAARRAATAWRGKLALVTGIAVVAMGLYTSPRRWSCGPKTLRGACGRSWSRAAASRRSCPLRATPAST